jgi:hypothetical protein
MRAVNADLINNQNTCVPTRQVRCLIHRSLSGKLETCERQSLTSILKVDVRDSSQANRLFARKEHGWMIRPRVAWCLSLVYLCWTSGSKFSVPPFFGHFCDWFTCSVYRGACAADILPVSRLFTTLVAVRSGDRSFTFQLSFSKPPLCIFFYM